MGLLAQVADRKPPDNDEVVHSSPGPGAGWKSSLQNLVVPPRCRAYEYEWDNLGSHGPSKNGESRDHAPKECKPSPGQQAFDRHPNRPDYHGARLLVRENVVPYINTRFHGNAQEAFDAFAETLGPYMNTAFYGVSQDAQKLMTADGLARLFQAAGCDWLCSFFGYYSGLAFEMASHPEADGVTYGQFVALLTGEEFRVPPSFPQSPSPILSPPHVDVVDEQPPPVVEQSSLHLKTQELLRELAGYVKARFYGNFQEAFEVFAEDNCSSIGPRRLLYENGLERLFLDAGFGFRAAAATERALAMGAKSMGAKFGLNALTYGQFVALLTGEQFRIPAEETRALLTGEAQPVADRWVTAGPRRSKPARK
jgi:hypothetical protein